MLFKNIRKQLKKKDTSFVIFSLIALAGIYFLYKTYLVEEEGFESAPSSLEKDKKEGKKLVLFYADWCGYCKKIKPAWDAATEEINVNGEVNMIKIDCGGKTAGEQEIMKKYEIEGYPTIIHFENGVKEKVYEEGYEKNVW